MSLAPLHAAPGICKVNSAYASGKQGPGRFIDGEHVRFQAGFPEKIGGWVQATQSVLVGTPRAMTDFRDGDTTACLGIGTESHLYFFDGDLNVLNDITPLRSIAFGTLLNPITTTIGSKVVAIADAAQNLANGDHVFLLAGGAVGGVTLNGWYTVSARSGTGYSVTVTAAAAGSAGPGGGTVAFNYPRKLLGTDPFATVSGSPTVTVTDTSHGAVSNDYVTFGGATVVAGLTINGEYQLTVVDPNTYTINAGAPAGSSTTGGGAAVNVTYDITMQGIGPLVPSAYGVGPYGVGPYGFMPGPSISQYAGWTLAAYGTDLIAAPIGGTIYLYDSTAKGRAFPVLNAPQSVLAIFVTPERFLFALGINANTMQIAWPDQSDITNWTTLPTNTANSGRSFQSGTFFVGGEPVANGVSLFWSNRSVFEASYIGDNNVYATPLASDLCGLIGPQAQTTMGGVAYWMSDHDFWQWNGSVSPMPSDDIRDYVFKNINTAQQWKSFARTNRAKKEVWFFYPSASSNEIDRYVIAHLDQPGAWSIGSMDRTAGHDSDLFTQPYGCDAEGLLYAEEQGVNGNGNAIDSFVEFAPADISNGDRNMDVFGFIPDFQRLVGSVALTINVRSYPQETPQVIGPITIPDDGSAALEDFRADGKLVGWRLDSNALDADYRFGLPRANVQPAGARL